MKILITGGNSTVARFLKPLLSGKHQIVTLGRTDCDINCNLLDLDFEFPKDVDVVLHTAASFGGETNEAIFETEEFNVMATLNLCQKATESKVKHFVHISSIFSYLDSNSKFYSIYSLSKKHSEDIVQFYLDRARIPFTILRPSQLYGNDPVFRKHQPFFYRLLDLASKGEQITLYGNNNPKRNYIHINDFVIILSKVIEERVVGEFDCASQTNTSYEEIARIAFDISNHPAKIEYLKDKPDIDDNIFPIKDELYDHIAIWPRITLKEGIAELIVKEK